VFFNSGGTPSDGASNRGTGALDIGMNIHPGREARVSPSAHDENGSFGYSAS